jgi:hypothetical protein
VKTSDELWPASEGRSIDLRLQVTFVHPPVSDVHRDDAEEEDYRKHDTDEHNRDTALVAETLAES